MAFIYWPLLAVNYLAPFQYNFLRETDQPVAFKRVNTSSLNPVFPYFSNIYYMVNVNKKFYKLRQVVLQEI